jgi:fatty-acyl-CoA synthase
VPRIGTVAGGGTVQFADWERRTTPALLDTTLGTRLRHWAHVRPDAAALHWYDEDVLDSLTWSGLLTRSQAGARYLLTLATPGDRVVLWAGNSVEWVLVQYAVALAGLVLVPVSPLLMDRELEHVVRTVEPAVVIASGDWRGESLVQRAGAVAAALGRPVPVVDIATWRDVSVGDGALPVVGRRDPLAIQFTSGTTGRPKGAVLCHQAAIDSAYLTLDNYGMGPDDVLVGIVPLNFSGGCIVIVVGALSIGAAVLVLAGPDPTVMLRGIEEVRATMLGCVPTMAFDLLRHPDFASRDISSLRILSTGGSTTLPSLVRELENRLDVRVHVAYGLSESLSVSATSAEDSDVDKAESIGRPLPHRDVRIVADDGSTAPVDVAGELWTRSTMAMSGYWDDPEATAGIIDADGWVHTGDVCTMDPRGILRILGRQKDVVIRGGANVYPAEVEEVLTAHPSVSGSAVVGRPDERLGELVVAYLRATDRLVDLSALEAHAREHLASYKVPSEWIVVDDFPLTSSGKVRKDVLREQLPVR